MMRLLVCGHSVGHPRQAMFFEKIAELGLAKICVLAPEDWYFEKCKDIVKENFELHNLERVGFYFYKFRLRGLGSAIKDFRPDMIYIVEEPYTIFARETKKIAELLQIPYTIFTWENVSERRYGAPHDSIEEDVIKSADILIAGNKGAKRRLIHRGGDGDKIAICPQNGINCDVFKPMGDVDKDYDLLYAGRMTEEKGVQFIKRVAKSLNLGMLWIGGRGEYTPSYGNYIGWANHLDLPKYYNMVKVFVTFPYSYNNYQEQGNFTIGESLACGTPVVCSNNGSILDFYKDAPLDIVEEADVDGLREAIKVALTKYELGGEDRIKWVRENLSNETVGKKIVKILEGGI